MNRRAAPARPFVDELPRLSAFEPGLVVEGAAFAHLLLNGVEADVRVAGIKRKTGFLRGFACPGCGKRAWFLCLYRRRFLCRGCLAREGVKYRGQRDNSVSVAHWTARRDKAQAKLDACERRLRHFEIEARLAELARHAKKRKD